MTWYVSLDRWFCGINTVVVRLNYLDVGATAFDECLHRLGAFIVQNVQLWL
jgi:hypothetical protein